MTGGGGGAGVSSVSASGGAVVDFARLYRRVRDADDGAASLSELASELARVSQQRRVGTTGFPADTLAPDERHLLHESSLAPSAADVRSGGGGGGGGGNAHRSTAEKGRPLARTLAAPSPFAEALRGGERAKRRRVRDALDAADDARYQRVQQVPWEQRILWNGTGCDSEEGGVQAPSSEQIVENENETVSESVGKRTAMVAVPVRSATISEPGKRKPVTSATGVETAVVVTGVDADFDMTRPRNYRWEIDGESARTVRSRTLSVPVAGASAAVEKLPCPLNHELLDDSWILAIGWRETRDMPESRLVLDANDAQLMFLAPDAEDVRPTLHIPKRKIGEAEQRQLVREQQERDKNSRVDGAMTTIGGSGDSGAATIGSAVGGKKKPRPRVVESIGVAHHSLVAVKLSLTKPELPLARLRALHRPRGRFKINERLQFASVLQKANSALAQKNTENALVTQVKKSSDLSPASGGKFVLIEYSEQSPPVLSSPGMAAQMLHYWRPPAEPAKGAAEKGKAAKNNKPKPPEMKLGKVITLGDRDESPFVGDVPAGRVVSSLNSKLYKVPLFPHKPLAPFVKTKESRREAGEYELFLLCRSASKGKKGSLDARSTMHVLELPEVFTAGQVEPQMEVPAPNSRSATEFIRPYMSFHILRLFKKKAGDGEHLKMEDVAHAFPNQSSTAIRKRMQEVATFERGGNDSGWWKKKERTSLAGNSSSSELDELRARIPPESVCLYESMMAGQRRLLDIGLTKWFTPTGVDGAISHLLKRLELRKQSLSAKLIAPQKLERRVEKKAESELWKADPVIRKLEKDIQVARYIEEQLQLSPWNLTNGYVECHLQGKGSGMLMLAGVGDPTGRGEGFSFIRIPQWRAKRKEGESEAAAAGGGGGSGAAKAVAEVTGTEADLRKLKMREMGDVLRNLGLADAEIEKLPRWDRVHMIREMSNRATAIGFRQLSRFARDGRKSLSAQQQAYRQRCDVVYARQMDVLSSARTTFSSDEESEGDDEDLDAWEEDIEADITGGGGEMDTIVSKRGPKNLFANGGGGRLDRSAESLREREEAVELRRLMEEMKEDSAGTTASTRQRSEVDATALRSQLRASGIQDRPTAPGAGAGATRPGSSHSASLPSSMGATPIDHMSRSTSPTRRRDAFETPTKRGVSTTAVTPTPMPGRKVVKRTTRMIAEDGTETVRIEFIVDEQHVARFRAMQQRKARQLESEERGSAANKRKRVLPAVPGSDGGNGSSSGGNSLLNKAKKRKQLQEELKQLQVTEEQNKAYQEMLQSHDTALESTPSKRGVVRCTQCGQAGHIRTNRSCPLYMADSGQPSAAASSKSAVRS